MTIAEFVERLAGPSRAGKGWVARCPAHEDRHASLSVSEGEDGRVLIYCHAGCTRLAVVDALGLSERDLFSTHNLPSSAALTKGRETKAAVLRSARFEIRDARGSLKAVHVREDLADGSKRMWWERADGSRGLNGTSTAQLPLYRAETLSGLSPAAGVLLTEGEKATDAVRSLRLPALGTVTGANGCPGRDALEVLRDRRVILWPDADLIGRKHMDQVGAALSGLASEVRILTWGAPESKADAADFIAAGGTRASLIDLVKRAPTWEAWGACAGGEDVAPAVLVRISDVKAERVSWLWAGRIPRGKLTVLDGDPGLGKSTLTLDLAARVSAGKPMPSEAGDREAAGAVILSAEDDIADTIRPRLEAAGADLNRVAALTSIRDDKGRSRLPSLPGDLEAVRGAIRRTRAGLLVVDPLMAYLSGRIDAHRDQDVRGALAQLAELAADTHVSVLIVRHLNKAPGGHPIYRGGGSIGIIGAARAGLLVAKDPEDDTRRVIAVTKSNLGSIPSALAYRLVPIGDASAVSWEGATDYRAADLLAEAGAHGENRGARDLAEDFLRALLADGPVRAEKVKAAAARAGIKWATVRRAQGRLGVRSTKQGGRFGGDPHWYWELTAEGAHSRLKVLTSKGEHLQAPVSIFSGEAADERSEETPIGDSLRALRESGRCLVAEAEPEGGAIPAADDPEVIS